jgi:hypothetical protein
MPPASRTLNPFCRASFPTMMPLARAIAGLQVAAGAMLEAALSHFMGAEGICESKTDVPLAKRRNTQARDAGTYPADMSTSWRMLHGARENSVH